MVDTSVARQQLGATTLNRKWFLDVNTGTDAAPVWVGVFGMQEFKPNTTGTFEDTSDFASGWKGSQKTAMEWSVEGKVKRASTAAIATTYDPGQEYLRTKSLLMGVAGRISVRFYEMEPSGPRIQAYQGFCSVDWTEEGGDMSKLSVASFKLSGDGQLDSITHPATP